MLKIACVLDESLPESVSGIVKQVLGSSDADPFWAAAEKNLLESVALYVFCEMPENQRSLPAIKNLLTAGAKDTATLKEIFDSLPDSHPAKVSYHIFDQLPKIIKTGVMAGLHARLRVIVS
ncbi:MAG: hypothetical protein K6U74_13365 [Firmicutes bacterium]|nr:hypothetical protein [Bacillota bacterium]